MLNVLGRSDLFLKLEIIKKILAVPTIVLGVLFGMKIMIAGMILNSFIAYYLNSYWSGRFIGYSLLEQIKDILPSFLLAAGMSAIVFIEGLLISLPPLPLLAIQLMTGALFITGICEAIHYKDYVYIKEILKDKFLKKNNL
jgi:teichuronic acid exporter